ncbi:MAG: NAD-dependent epimerase/dehydratase family protein [Azospirillaceae bacterium]
MSDGQTHRHEDDGVVLVTGASGFVGRHVMAALGARAVPLRVRAGDDIDAALVRSAACGPVTAVIHLAARAHRMSGDEARDAEAFRRDNAALTADLAAAAADRGIRRFVFLSTIGVHGPRPDGVPIGPETPPAPSTAYGHSKLEAERALARIASDRGLEPIIVRAPLVYGAGAPGNLARLASAIERGLPLPLAAIRNRRSLINVADLAELMVVLVDAATVPPSPLPVADTEAVSTPQIVRTLAVALNRPARLVAVPPRILRAVLAAAGRRAMAEQLLGSLQVDPSAIIETTGWTPRRGLREGLSALARARHADNGSAVVRSGYH